MPLPRAPHARFVPATHTRRSLPLQGLDGALEKRSEVLGRNATWSKQQRINRLPKYLCVQFMRFYWKLTPNNRDAAGVNCKMMRVRRCC